jgi:hypothetical protein
MNEGELRDIIPKVMHWLENKPNTSNEDEEKDVGDEEEDVGDEEKAINNEEEAEADEEEEVTENVKGKLFLAFLFEEVDYVKFSYKGHV